MIVADMSALNRYFVAISYFRLPPTMPPSSPCLDRLRPHRSLTSPRLTPEIRPRDPHGKRTLQRARARKALAAGVERERHVPHQGQEQAAQALPAGDVPLSVGAHPHGARAQLHPGRRDRPLHARQGLQCAAPHGLGRLRPAGRERRHRAQGAPQDVDLREHRHHARPAQGHGRVDRLEPRVRHLRSRLLRAPAAAVPGFLQEEAGLPQHRQGQLGPGGKHRAGQRAGDRRARLALRRAGGAARPDAVVLQDHRLCRRAAGTRWTASQASGRTSCARSRGTGSGAPRGSR